MAPAFYVDVRLKQAHSGCMSKKRFPRLPALMLAIAVSFAGFTAVTTLTGCKSPTVQKQAVNTLFSLHKTADATLDGYLDLVNRGTLATNSVPKVLAAYTTFQNAYNLAVVIVASNTNSVAPQSVIDAATSFANTVTSAKKGSL